MNWLIVQGKAKISKNLIEYVPEKFINEQGQEGHLAAIIGADKDFESGVIEFDVKINDKKALCQVLFNSDTGTPLISVGLNTNGYLYGIIKLSNNRWENLYVTGQQDTFELTKEHRVKLKISGSIIELFVMGVKVATAYEEIRKAQIRLLLQSSKKIEIKNFKVFDQKPKAFVIMQFSDDYNQLYEEVIRPVTEEFGIQCVRADEYHTTNPILEDIVNSIKEASIVIADITPDNPNVFYEVGYSHALEKPTILLCDKKRTKLPFDVSSFRTLFYDNTIAGKSQVEKRLRKFLDNIF